MFQLFSRRSGVRPGLPHTLSLSIALAFSGHSASVLAEEADSNASSPRLDEVVVSARRIDESARELPFTINVVNAQEVSRRKLMSLEDLLRSIPGVDVSSFGGSNDTNVRIRGMGSMFQISAEDSSVVVNVDGVPLSSRTATLAVMDIERIEVLKGPQATLFGRNSEAGAVNVTTRRPSRETTGEIRASVGQESQYSAEGALGGPLSDTLSARVSVRAAGEDSVIHNAASGKPQLEPEDFGWRASLLWGPTAETSVLVIAESQDQRDRVGLELVTPFVEPPSQDVSAGTQFAKNVQDRFSAQVDHDFARVRMTSLTSVTHSEASGRGCQGPTLTSFYGLSTELCQDQASEQETLNQELRWSSVEGAEYFWLGGVTLGQTTRRADNAIPLFFSDNRRRFETKSAAAFGEVTYPLSPSLKLTAGLRHSWEEKLYRARFVTSGTSDRRSLNDDYSTGRLALSWALAPRVHTYLTFARGYKSGGFIDYASQVADGEPLKPAVVNSVELGVKAESAGRMWALNAAAYANRAKDDHLLGYDVNTQASLGLNTDTESQGAELELSWRPTDHWDLGAGVNFTDAEITRDVDGASGGFVAAGNRVPDVARWSATGRVTFSTPLPWQGADAPGLVVDVRHRYLGRRAVDPQNHFDLPANRKLDARVALSLGRAEVFLWGDNLLDERNHLYGYYYGPGVSTGMVTRGRTFGAGASYRY